MCHPLSGNDDGDDDGDDDDDMPILPPAPKGLVLLIPPLHNIQPDQFLHQTIQSLNRQVRN
jgi:hypothetical protein